MLLVTITAILTGLSAIAVFLLFYISVQTKTQNKKDRSDDIDSALPDEIHTDVNRIGAWVEYEAHKYADNEVGYIRQVGVVTGSAPSLTLAIDAQYRENAETIGKDLRNQLQLLTGQNWTVDANYTEIEGEGTAPSVLKA